MSSPEVSLVSHSALQAREKGRKITDISGRKCLEQYMRYVPAGSWARMFSELLIGRKDWYSSRCVLIWKLKATKYNRIYFQLAVSAHRINDTEPGLLHTSVAIQNGKEIEDLTKPGSRKVLLPTPTTCDAQNSSIPPSQIRRNNLAGAYLRGMLPTPTASDATMGSIIGVNDRYIVNVSGLLRKISGRGTEGGVSLGRLSAMNLLPAPREQETANCHMLGNNGDSTTHIKCYTPYQTGTISRLNPLYVEEMMGFPNGWILRPFLKVVLNASIEEM